MEYTKLGNSNLIVSKICMGCMGFGDGKKDGRTWTINEEESTQIIKKGLELGINFFDTAIGYQDGISERYLGKILKKLVEREKVVIATKFLPRTEKDIKMGITAQEHIENNLNKSLKNLGVEYIDLYIYHMWDYNTPIYDIMEGLNNMIKVGKIKHIGISNCYAWQLAKANSLAEKEGFVKFISVQGHYNLIFREEEREMIPYCEEENIALTPYSPLAGGRLAKKIGENSKRLQEDTYAKFKYDKTEEQDKKIIQRVVELADKKGVSMTEISLAWLLSKGTIPVVGATKSYHIEGAVKALKIKLTKEEIDYLEENYIAHDLVGVMAENRSKK